MHQGKNQLEQMLHTALIELGGSATLVDVCRHVWYTNVDELREEDDLYVAVRHTVVCYEASGKGNYEEHSGLT
jgi:hypothetical protein